MEKRIGFSGNIIGQDHGRELKKGESTFKSIKNDFPKNALFNINSIVFNLENNKEEVLNKYNCFYNASLEALCILIEEKMKYSDLSKEIVKNIMDFAKKIGTGNLILLIDRKNKDYIKILQGMMTVGFSIYSNMKMIKIQSKEYKVLKMILKSIPDEIEEIEF